MRQVDDGEGNKLFDTKVHHYNPKTGQLTKVTPYIKHVNPYGEYFEDQTNGKFYNPVGEEIQNPKKVGGQAPPVASNAGVLPESMPEPETKPSKSK